MSLIEEYYELNEAEEISVLWKMVQIIFYVLAGCFGLWCGYTMAIIRLKFQDKCYLYTTVVKVTGLKEEFSDNNNINWEGDLWCDYCQYCMVSSFILATIWATFFLMCGKGGKSLTGLPQPWRIVGPSFIFNFIYFIVALSAAITIQTGTDKFCTHNDFDTKMNTMLNNCASINQILKEDEYVTSLELEIVVKTSWACAGSWLILFILSFLRIICVSDFHMYKVCVFRIGDSVQNKKEEVLRVTNYEEPKRLRFTEEQATKFSSADFEEGLDNLDEGKKTMKGRGKFNKKKVQYNSMQAQIESNTTFYITADIRMLNREKKRKISLSLDEAFEKKITFASDARKINSIALSEPINLELYNNITDKNLSPINLKQVEFKEIGNELESANSLHDLKKNHPIHFKKCL